MNTSPSHSRSRLSRAVYFSLGSGCTGLGVAGLILPLLPGTIFLLLAAFFYARSSDRAYRWLTTNRWFGSYVRYYRENHGMPRRAKFLAIGLLWLGIGISALFAPALWVDAILVACALGVTIYLLRLPTIEAAPAKAPESSDRAVALQ